MPLVKPEQIRTPWHEFWRRFRRQHMAMFAGLFVLLLIMVAIFARWLTPFDAENYFDYDRLNDGPSMLHWFGVDSLGRDIFSRVLVGAQISLAAGVFAVFIGAAIGTVLGLLAGYYEGWWDRLIMRICDVLFAFPGILLAIAVVAVLGSGIANVIIAVAIFSIPAFARLVRGNTLVLKQQTFIESARSIGASDTTIIFNHILPGTVSSIVVFFTMRIGTSIISAASLSFLGLGAQPPTPADFRAAVGRAVVDENELEVVKILTKYAVDALSYIFFHAVRPEGREGRRESRARFAQAAAVAVQSDIKMIYPANFEQKIGFDRLREQVAALCTMRAARGKLAEETFSTSAREIGRRLELADQMRLLLDMEHDFPGGEYPDVDHVVAKLRVEGNCVRSV